MGHHDYWRCSSYPKTYDATHRLGNQQVVIFRGTQKPKNSTDSTAKSRDTQGHIYELQTAVNNNATEIKLAFGHGQMKGYELLPSGLVSLIRYLRVKANLLQQSAREKVSLTSSIRRQLLIQFRKYGSCPLIRCPICYMELPLSMISGTDCRHIVCTRCLKAWFKQKPTCPICRSNNPRIKVLDHPMMLEGRLCNLTITRTEISQESSIPNDPQN